MPIYCINITEIITVSAAICPLTIKSPIIFDLAGKQPLFNCTCFAKDSGELFFQIRLTSLVIFTLTGNKSNLPH